MAGIVATSVDFRFGSNGSASTKIDNSTKFNSVDFPRVQDLKDITPFQASGNAKQYAVGLNDATFKAEAFYDATLYAQLVALINYTTAVDFTFGPAGTTSGYPKYTGSFFLKSVGAPVKVGDVLMLSCEFQVTGLITATVY